MNPQTAVLIVNIINLIIEKGIPAYIEWKDGVSLTEPTLDDFEVLKVQKMSEKEKDNE